MYQKLIDTLTIDNEQTGEQLTQLSLNLTLFFRHEGEPPKYIFMSRDRIPGLRQKQQAVATIFNQFEQILAQECQQPLRYCVNPQTQVWVDLQQDNFTPLQTLFDFCRHTSPLKLYYHNSEQANDACAGYFSYQAASTLDQTNKLNYLSIGLPLSYFSTPERIAQYVQWVQQWTELLQPLHGYAGINLATHNQHFQTLDAVYYNVAQHIQGVDLNFYPRMIYDLGASNDIKGVQWLTILHPDLIQDQQKALDNLVKEDLVERHICPHGTHIYQVGSKPEEFDIPDSQYSLATVLEPLRSQNLQPPYGNAIFQPIEDNSFVHPDVYQAWLARFTPLSVLGQDN